MLKARYLTLCIAALAATAASQPAAAALLAQPAPEGVQAGIAAWQAGDYASAVATWRPLAESGNADAQFNLGQAHRLGRGVPQDLRQAEQWFERAARQRHEQAGTNLGLLLFQNGRAREAMPWIQAAALRGDPRAQYVFGTALFNGDIVRRDLPRAYAMMSAAAAQNFPQADAQLREMDRFIPEADRDRGRAMAAQMGVPASPRTEHANIAEARPAAPVQPRPRTAEARPPGARPDAGVSFPIPDEQGRPVQPQRPVGRAQIEPRQSAPAARAQRRAEAPVERSRPAAAAGNWRVQLGAFSNDANARRQWDIVRRQVSAVASLEPAYVRAGSITRLRAGPLASRAAADRLCASVRASGQACIPVNP